MRPLKLVSIRNKNVIKTMKMRGLLLIFGFVASLSLGHAQVATPTFSGATINADGEYEVTVSCSTAGARIRYNTQGLDPSTIDAVVTSGTTITVRPDPEEPANFQVMARAWDSGDQNRSAVATSTALSSPNGYAVTGGNATQHAVGLRNNGEVIGWGSQYKGRLGNGVTTNSSVSPTVMKKLVSGSPVTISDAVAVAAGSVHSVVADASGYAWVTGDNAHGQLGNNTTTDSSYLNRVIKSTTSTDYLTGITQVAAGLSFSEALDTSGQVWAWGWQADGRLGNGVTNGDKLYAGKVETAPSTYLTGMEKIAVGEAHTLAVDDDVAGGTVWVWGENAAGKLGVGDTTRRERAVKMKASLGVDFTGVADVSAGSTHSVMLKTDGTVWCCGQQSGGRLGNGASGAGSVTYPVQVQAVSSAGDPYRENPASTLQKIVMIAAGPKHTLALKEGGTVWAWGSNAQGQLGDGTTTNRDQAVKVPGLTDIVWIGTGGLDGYSHTSFALKKDGTLYAWGSNGEKELADGTTTDRSSPVVSSANNFFKPKQDVSVAAIEPFVKENTGTGVFRISRSLFSQKTSSLTVNYTVSGTATAGTTYTALSGSATIAANQSYVDVSVAPISNLATYTGNKTVIVSLTGSPNYTVGVGIAGVTIEDQTASPSPVVYIADRSAEATGTPPVPPVGSGTLLDPYDGSTVDHFDDAMRTVMASNNPSAPNYGTIVRLGSGNFRTRGNLYINSGLGWQIQSGMKIIGSDTPGNPDQTTLTLDVSGLTAGAESSLRMIGTYGFASDCVISNLTLDCDSVTITANATNGWSESSIQGISFRGDNNVVDGVTIRGVRGVWQSPFYPYNVVNREAWSVILGAAERDAFSNKIINTTSEDYFGDYGCGPAVAFFMGSNTSPWTYFRGWGLIDNCAVNNNPNWLGYGISGTLRNSTTNNTGFGVRMDTAILENVRIVGNEFTNCTYYGMQLAIDGFMPDLEINHPKLTPCRNIYIADNYIELSSTSTNDRCGILLQSGSEREILNMEITGNLIESLASSSTSQWSVAVDNPKYQDSIVHDNESDRSGYHVNAAPSFLFQSNDFPGVTY
jgi:alpha-tubulin suppressor-like RCC1 family protein